VKPEDQAQVGEDRAQVGIVTGAGRGMGLACARRPRPWTRWALSQRPAWPGGWRASGPSQGSTMPPGTGSKRVRLADL